MLGQEPLQQELGAVLTRPSPIPFLFCYFQSVDTTEEP